MQMSRKIIDYEGFRNSQEKVYFSKIWSLPWADCISAIDYRHSSQLILFEKGSEN